MLQIVFLLVGVGDFELFRVWPVAMRSRDSCSPECMLLEVMASLIPGSEPTLSRFFIYLDMQKLMVV